MSIFPGVNTRPLNHFTLIIDQLLIRPIQRFFGGCLILVNMTNCPTVFFMEDTLVMSTAGVIQLEEHNFPVILFGYPGINAPPGFTPSNNPHDFPKKKLTQRHKKKLITSHLLIGKA